MHILAFPVMQPLRLGPRLSAGVFKAQVFAFICAPLNYENVICDVLFSRVECNCGASAVSGRSSDDQHPAFMSCPPAYRMVHKQYAIGFKPLFLSHG